MTTATIFVAWFAFGYSVSDIIGNVIANHRINKFVKEFEKND